MKKFFVIMMVALTLGVVINALLPDVSFAGPKTQYSFSDYSSGSSTSGES